MNQTFIKHGLEVEAYESEGTQYADVYGATRKINSDYCASLQCAMDTGEIESVTTFETYTLTAAQIAWIESIAEKIGY